MVGRGSCAGPCPGVIDGNSSNVLRTLNNCPLPHKTMVVWLGLLLDSFHGIPALFFLRGWVEFPSFLSASAKLSQKQAEDD